MILAIATLLATSLLAADQVTYKADAPSGITRPDKVHTRYAGNLEFRGGFPSEETVAKSYDFLDTARATLVFTNIIGIGSMRAML
jgi:hypothetical protein